MGLSTAWHAVHASQRQLLLVGKTVSSWLRGRVPLKGREAGQGCSQIGKIGGARRWLPGGRSWRLGVGVGSGLGEPGQYLMVKKVGSSQTTGDANPSFAAYLL